MRIGINLLYLIPGRVGGTETYARELVESLSHILTGEDKLILYCGRETTPTFQKSKRIEIVTLPFYSKNRFARILLEQKLLPLYCIKDNLDVIFSLGYSAPFIHKCPSVVTIHDLNWYYHPEDFNPLSRLLWKVLTTLSARTSDHIITDSQASAKSIVSILKIAKSKITPILHGVPKKVTPAQLPKGKYLLTVVAGYPHKNVTTLLHAFAEIVKADSDVRLIICGLGGKADKENEQRIEKLGLSNRVEVLGYVSREELAALYKGARAFIFPSAYEGFGYPVVEAMSYGTPVISSNAFSLEEVVGEGGILVDPYDSKGFTKAISDVINSKSKREELVKKGTKRLGGLKWSTTARETLNVLQEVTKR